MSTVEVSTLSSLFDLAVQVKDTAENILATTPGGIPDVSYVSPSAPVFDCCPALIVWVPTLTEEATSPLAPIPSTGQRTSLGRINLATIHVLVIRCAPSWNKTRPPTPDEKEAVAEIVLTDGWALWTGFFQAIKEGEFKSLCQTVHFDDGSFIREQGGCIGWDFTLRPELAGIIV